MIEDSVKETNLWLGSWERVCPVCKKHFFPAPEHVFKIKNKYYCKYSCFIKADKPKPKQKKKVYQYSRDLKLLKVFDSAREASFETLMSVSHIRILCKSDVNKQGGKFIWSYKPIDNNKEEGDQS